MRDSRKGGSWVRADIRRPSMMDSISWDALTFPRDWIAVIFSSSWEMACSHSSGFWDG